MTEMRAILHVDMDAFFAAIEILDNPALKGKPVIVGGTPQGRGVVATASYEARKFGVHSAMPAATAVRLCPQGVFLPPRGQRYGQISRQVRALFDEYTPRVEPVSVDEAFLDVTGQIRSFSEAAGLARRIKRHIATEVRLTCSVGVAPNKYLAKLASEMDKPDGLTVLAPESAARLIAPLPVSRVWGVGPQAAERLEALGIRTIGDLAAYPSERLARRLGESRAETLQALARGEDARPVEGRREAKSISREATFGEFLSDREPIEKQILALAEDVGAQLRAAGRTCRTVTLKVRDERFVTMTRSITLTEPTDLGTVLYSEALRLLRTRIRLRGRKVRLLGVGASGLAAHEAGQLELFPDERQEKDRRVAEAVDRVNRAHGSGTVVRARLLRDT